MNIDNINKGQPFFSMNGESKSIFYGLKGHIVKVCDVREDDYFPDEKRWNELPYGRKGVHYSYKDLGYIEFTPEEIEKHWKPKYELYLRKFLIDIFEKRPTEKMFELLYGGAIREITDVDAVKNISKDLNMLNNFEKNWEISESVVIRDMIIKKVDGVCEKALAKKKQLLKKPASKGNPNSMVKWLDEAVSKIYDLLKHLEAKGFSKAQIYNYIASLLMQHKLHISATGDLVRRRLERVLSAKSVPNFPKSDPKFSQISSS